MNTPTPTLRTSIRQSGWDRVLFSEFRESPLAPEVQRVERILSLMVAAHTHLQDWRKDIPLQEKSAWLLEHKRRRLSEAAYMKTLDLLNEALAHYRWFSEFCGDVEGFSERLITDRDLDPGLPVWEHAIVRYLLDATKTPGTLSLFRRCSDCAQWFYAATSHQRFCGETCRRHHAGTSAEFKEKRRIYMQEVYRPQQKERDARMVALAKGTRSSKRKEGKA